MNLPRIVDTDQSDPSQAIRAALECFAPVAITIRPQRGRPEVPVRLVRSR